MKKYLLGALFLALCSSAIAQEEFDLPTDKNAPILTMEFSGGFRMPEPDGFVKKPHLQILANGRVVHSPNSPDYEATEYQMTEEELNEFLESVVNEHSVYEIDGDEIREEFMGAGHRMMMADAPTTRLGIYLGRGEHTISLLALSSITRQMPDHEAAANLSKIVEKCRYLVKLADIGGHEELQRYTELANAEMEKNGQEPFEVTDLSGVRLPSGVRQKTISFSKNIPQGDKDMRISVKIVNDGEVDKATYSTSMFKRRAPRTPRGGGGIEMKKPGVIPVGPKIQIQRVK